ncbi:MAG TPA: thioredoxin family protein [Ktedonobacterales bacterium]|nr:thioredoxin family protein [Ktedonobacterales bacterium]
MTTGLLLRLGALVAVGLATWLIVLAVRAYAAARKRQTLAAAPADLPAELGAATDGAGVRVLAFSSEDCSPCHTLQRPALARLLDERQGQVSVTEIDAPSSPELTQRYAVLTVPTTVVLDATGKAHAVNYGFANAAKLLAQVDGALGAQAVSA